MGLLVTAKKWKVTGVIDNFHFKIRTHVDSSLFWEFVLKTTDPFACSMILMICLFAMKITKCLVLFYRNLLMTIELVPFILHLDIGCKMTTFSNKHQYLVWCWQTVGKDIASMNRKVEDFFIQLGYGRCFIKIYFLFVRNTVISLYLLDDEIIMLRRPRILWKER